MKKALFLDRDGTIIEDTHYLHKPEEVSLIHGVTEALQLAIQKNYLLFLFTNQSGIGRGYYTLEDTISCNREMIRQLNIVDNLFAEICIATETPDQPQNYRKPSPRFILEMVQKHDLNKNDCWMVGDRLSDLQAGINAKVKAAFVKTGKSLDGSTMDFLQIHNIPFYNTLLELSQALP